MPDRPLQVDDDEDMDDEEDDDNQDLLLQVVIEPDASEILGIPPEEVQEAQDEQMEEVEDGSSPKGEEPVVGTGDSSKEERPELPYAASPEARYGNYIVSQLTRSQEQTLRHWTFAMSGLVDQDDPRPVPRTLEEINTFQLAMMVDFVADAQHQEFHSTFPALTGLQVS